jgi:hypothetical protein
MSTEEQKREADRARARAYYYAHREEVHAKAKARREAKPEIAQEQYSRYITKPGVRAKRVEANRQRYRQVYSKDPAYREKASAYKRKWKEKLAPEAKAEAHLVESVKLVGGMCPKFIDPGRRGAPDRMVMLPGRPVYFVEMKREKVGKLSPWQERYHADLRALGHRVWVLWSKEDVDEFLASI